jgi:hypothetical protein
VHQDGQHRPHRIFPAVARQNGDLLLNQSDELCSLRCHSPCKTGSCSGYPAPSHSPRVASENLALRQQLTVLKRRHPQPRFAISDKLLWVMLRRLWYPVHSRDQTDSDCPPAICQSRSRKPQNQSFEDTRGTDRFQVSNDLASASQYGCCTCMASRRNPKNWQEAKFVIFVADVSDVRFGASLATSQ